MAKALLSTLFSSEINSHMNDNHSKKSDERKNRTQEIHVFQAHTNLRKTVVKAGSSSSKSATHELRFYRGSSARRRLSAFISEAESASQPAAAEFLCENLHPTKLKADDSRRIFIFAQTITKSAAAE